MRKFIDWEKVTFRVMLDARVATVLLIATFMICTMLVMAQSEPATVMPSLTQNWQTNDAILAGRIVRNDTRIDIITKAVDRNTVAVDELNREIGRMEGIGLSLGTIIIVLNILGFIRKPPPLSVGLSKEQK